MTWLYALQFAAPLILIGWLVWAPARSGLGFVVQVFGSVAALAAMALLGIWLLPPWWAPFVFAAALAVATWLGWRRIQPIASAVPATGGAWIVGGLFLALGCLSTYGTFTAWQSRSNPVAGAVNLAFPLEPGRYLVVNGGSSISTNAHLETLNAGVPRYRTWRGQSYGVDLVALDGFGLRARGVQPADPSAYVIYGARVWAPCAGQVLIAVDGLPDMWVPEADREHLAGNHVMLRCDQADVLLGHLQPGSVRVHAGAQVAVGDWLGSVGNSGNTGEPHLHIHAQGPGSTDAPLGGDPRPLQFKGHFPVRGDRIEVP
ncbi:M23 family metallopeptidase [Hydrogenophaga sp. PAMC20947]|uniref:peptidoglycan DD-metalloendopeptidase family protein n=1 Tax=Hydrogenophaga sp. PAMC20947 TaxID=2565558 RepID=UPI00109DAB6F|nr:M23 family metallopeptidase [Hydrogenophaga sp. PAMC20947]QCB45564.1 M23 family metallopeptidase [Hydrogenophaga sp. PAMC20947]